MSDLMKRILTASFFVFVALIMLAIAFIVYRDVTYDTIRLSIAEERGESGSIRTARTTFGVRIGDTIALSQRDGWHTDYTITIKEFRDDVVIVELGGGDLFASFHGSVHQGQLLDFEYGGVYRMAPMNRDFWVRWTLMFR